MLQIFLASLLLSIIHAFIPNHWLPLIAIGRTEKWTHPEILLGTGIAGFAHTLSTVLIGVVVGVIGYRLSSSYGLISGIIAPAILVLLGTIYLVLDIFGKRHHHHFGEDLLPKQRHSLRPHTVQITDDTSFTYVRQKSKKKTKWAILLSLSLGMFFTPCTEIEAYYFQASTIGWSGIWMVSAVYTLVTILGMVLFVYLGLKGVKHLESRFLEHHEKRITGIVLIAVGLFTFFVER